MGTFGSAHVARMAPRGVRGLAWLSASIVVAGWALEPRSRGEAERGPDVSSPRRDVRDGAERRRTAVPPAERPFERDEALESDVRPLLLVHGLSVSAVSRAEPDPTRGHTDRGDATSQARERRGTAS
jgi:hypothetical protein